MIHDPIAESGLMPECVLESVPKGARFVIWSDDTQTLPERPDRRPMAADRPADPRGQARRPAPQVRDARGPQRPALPQPRGLLVAGDAPRPAPLEDLL